MDQKSENLSKDDLFLLLESYKNSIEMNTIISQQLTAILDYLSKFEDHDAIADKELKDKFSELVKTLENIKEKYESHDKDGIRSSDKILYRINILYVAFGSIIASLLWLIYQLASKYEMIHAIADKVGV